MASTTTRAERERCVAEAIQSGEMEGLHVAPAGREDAQEYIAGRIDCDELVARARRGLGVAPVEHRVFFRNVKPYAVPESLDELRGPPGGVIELPHTVLWAPGGGRVDLDEEGGVGLAYRAVVAEGTVADQVAVLNRDRLSAVWQELLLPRRPRELWEARFPELRTR